MKPYKSPAILQLFCNRTCLRLDDISQSLEVGGLLVKEGSSEEGKIKIMFYACRLVYLLGILNGFVYDSVVFLINKINTSPVDLGKGL